MNTATSPDIFNELFFRLMLWIWLQNLKFAALPVPEIIVGTPKIWADKGRYSSSWGEPTSELWDVTCHMGSHLPPDTSECAPPNPRYAGWYSIYLPRRDGRLSWRICWLDSATAGSRTIATFRSRVRRPTTAPPRQLSSSEDRMIVGRVVLAWYQTVTDRETDGIYRSQYLSLIHIWRCRRRG